MATNQEMLEEMRGWGADMQVALYGQWSQAAQSDARSRPSEPMAACVWPVQAASACQPVLAPPSGPPAGGVPSRVREPGGSTKPSLLPQPDFSKTTVTDSDRQAVDDFAGMFQVAKEVSDIHEFEWAELGWNASEELNKAYAALRHLEETRVARMSGGGGQTGGGPLRPVPDPVPPLPCADPAPDTSDRDRKLWAAIGRGGRRAGPGVVWEGDRR